MLIKFLVRVRVRTLCQICHLHSVIPARRNSYCPLSDLSPPVASSLQAEAEDKDRMSLTIIILIR